MSVDWARKRLEEYLPVRANHRIGLITPESCEVVRLWERDSGDIVAELLRELNKLASTPCPLVLLKCECRDFGPCDACCAQQLIAKIDAI